MCNIPNKGMSNNKNIAKLLFLKIKNNIMRDRKIIKLKSVRVLNEYKKVGDKTNIRADNKDVRVFMNFLAIK